MVTIDAYTYVGTTDTVDVDVSSSGVTTTINAAIDSAGDRLASCTNTGAFGWILPDLHGNVVAQFGKSSATIVDVFRYDAYGKTIGTALPPSSVPSPWRFQGRILESTAGSATYDFAARAYVPDLGTFTSLDSVSGGVMNPLSLNRYLYANANPETLVDPDGHCAKYVNDGMYSYCAAADPVLTAAQTAAIKADTDRRIAQIRIARALQQAQRLLAKFGSILQGMATNNAPRPKTSAAPRDCGFFGTSCINLGGALGDTGRLVHAVAELQVNTVCSGSIRGLLLLIRDRPTRQLRRSQRRQVCARWRASGLGNFTRPRCPACTDRSVRLVCRCCDR
jgi:RHS repeat-associated protein